jgi:hypothetical protein
LKTKKQIDKSLENIEEILEVCQYLKNNSLQAYKYNTSLDEGVQNFCSYEALIEVQQNGKTINIYNKKPIERHEHVLESDPEELKKM